ncbi:MAG: hypothetical protein IK014_03510 [Lachnospiraceae bacterium]|nr:hypothetical protein [Lachnospiraceae bacterium]
MKKMTYQAPNVWFDNMNLAAPASCNAAVVVVFGIAFVIWDGVAVWNAVAAVNYAAAAVAVAHVVAAGPQSWDCAD